MRDDGVSYGDYLEQLTYLIFLNMSNEYTPLKNKPVSLPGIPGRIWTPSKVQNWRISVSAHWKSRESRAACWRKFSIDDILKRDKTSLDIFWIKDKSLAELDNLPDPDVLAADIVGNLQSAMDSFQELMATLKK